METIVKKTLQPEVKAKITELRQASHDLSVIVNLCEYQLLGYVDSDIHREISKLEALLISLEKLKEEFKKVV